MWQKIPTVITAIIFSAGIILTGCTSAGRVGSSSTMVSGNTQASPMQFSSMPQHIALLLPLTGPLANQAGAIRNGFFATYYQNKQQGVAPTITVYDTNQRDIKAVYQEAVQAGADFVVGPLTKSNVATLANSQNFTVPTLALNTLDNNDSRINRLYQFGLSPLDEALQAAIRMARDQKNRIIIIAQTGDWSNRALQAFEKQWLSQGGVIVAKLSFSNFSDLNNGVPKLLNIDQSQQRTKLLQSTLGEKVRMVLRRRKDFDAVFVMATPTQARQVLPLLNFYYANDVPIYATSAVYSGKAGTSADYDLNGIIFNDMPWILKSDAALPAATAKIRQSIMTLWGNSYSRYARLYGLGVDAYQLIPNLSNLSSSPQNSVLGVTGQLHVLSNQHIYRELPWAKMVNGSPQLLAP